MDTLRQDIRYAIRRLVKSPGFTIISALTLALGIGANSAIFSVVNGVLLRPLPYPHPEQLVALYHFSEGTRSSMSGPNFTDLRSLSQTMADAAAISRPRLTMTGQGDPVRLDAAAVTWSLFDVLGVRPMIGRSFRPEDNEPGRDRSVILAYRLWQQRFGRDPGIIGKQIVLDGVSREVIGVMPEGFAYPSDRVLWVPMEHTRSYLTEERAAWYLRAVGRAKPGVPLERVAAEVETIGAQLAREYPDKNDGVGFRAVPLLESMVGDIRKAVLVLLGAVGFVLLIACANVANLLLARAAAREGEIAVRRALGAGRARLVRQLLTESVILSVIGGALGLLLAIWGVELLVSLTPLGIPRLDNVRIDSTVALFTFGLSIVTGIVFGLVPAFQSTSRGLVQALKEGGRSAQIGRAGARLRGVLVVAEMSLAVVLLTGAGLLLRSFTKLAGVDPGFSVAQALTFELTLPDSP